MIVIPPRGEDVDIPEQWKDRINIPYNLYTYSQIYAGQDGKNMILKHNEYVKNLIQDKIYLKKLSIIIDNIKVDEVYKLPASFFEKVEKL